MDKKSVGYVAGEELRNKGGPGSGNFGHGGRPGAVGGSSPSTRVGITSARPGKPNAQVAREKLDFEHDLKETPARNVSVTLGRGGWDGGWEPTFVTSYDGNGKAFEMLVGKAKQYDQDGLIIMNRVPKGTPDSNPVTTFGIGERIGPTQYAQIEKILTDHDFGGWTWTKGKDGKSQLILACVPEYGMEKGKFATDSATVKGLISAMYPKTKTYTENRKVHLIKDSQYDGIIKDPEPAKEAYL
jgi:hypothetical protein